MVAIILKHGQTVEQVYPAEVWSLNLFRFPDLMFNPSHGNPKKHFLHPMQTLKEVVDQNSSELNFKTPIL